VKYLLDTNVISEIQRPNCDPRVKAFIHKIPQNDMVICSLSIGEICYGIERLPASKKKHELSIWLYMTLPEWFRNRVVDLDTETMLEWGKLRARMSRSIPIADALIAAAAIRCRLVLITRNTKDFEDIPGLELINPWEF
jgi:predicted nucleic acid-binding protein